MVVKRVQVMQENIKRVKQGKPLLEPANGIFGSDELSDLDAEFHELAASMLRQNLPEEALQLTHHHTQHHSSVNAGG
jgi:cobalamin biosynthesis Co2+ chelatase CbiK